METRPVRSLNKLAIPRKLPVYCGFGALHVY